MGIHITRLVNLNSNWFSGFWDSSVVLHLSFLNSLNCLVTNLCRRLTSAVKVGSLVTCHCLRSRFSGVFHPEHQPGSGFRVTMRATFGCGSHQSLDDGAGEILNTSFDIHTVEQFQIERDFGFQLGLEIGPVSAPDIRSIRWSMKW